MRLERAGKCGRLFLKFLPFLHIYVTPLINISSISLSLSCSCYLLWLTVALTNSGGSDVWFGSSFMKISSFFALLYSWDSAVRKRSLNLNTKYWETLWRGISQAAILAEATDMWVNPYGTFQPQLGFLPNTTIRVTSANIKWSSRTDQLCFCWTSWEIINWCCYKR